MELRQFPKQIPRAKDQETNKGVKLPGPRDRNSRTMQSWDNPPAMNRTLDHLRAVSPEAVTGIRQHYLRFKPGQTAQIQAEAGLVYDASLGFSEHDGFRNSYCWPFKFFILITGSYGLLGDPSKPYGSDSLLQAELD